MTSARSTGRIGVSLLSFACAQQVAPTVEGGTEAERALVAATYEALIGDVLADARPTVHRISIVEEPVPERYRLTWDPSVQMVLGYTTRRGHEIALRSGLDFEELAQATRHELCHAMDNQGAYSGRRRRAWTPPKEMAWAGTSIAGRRRETLAYLCEFGSEGLQRLLVGAKGCLAQAFRAPAEQILDELYLPRSDLLGQHAAVHERASAWPASSDASGGTAAGWAEGSNDALIVIPAGRSRTGALRLGLGDGTWAEVPGIARRSRVRVDEYEEMEAIIGGSWRRSIARVEGGGAVWLDVARLEWPDAVNPWTHDVSVITVESEDGAPIHVGCLPGRAQIHTWTRAVAISFDAAGAHWVELTDVLRNHWGDGWRTFETYD